VIIVGALDSDECLIVDGSGQLTPRILAVDDDEPAALDPISERWDAAHPHAFLFEAAILSRMRSPMTSRANCAKDNSTLSVKRPIEVVVLNCRVADNKRIVAPESPPSS